MRNGNILWYRRFHYPEHAVRAYWQGFDGSSATEIVKPSKEFLRRHDAGIAAAKATGCFGPKSYPDESDGINKELRDRLDTILANFATAPAA